MEDRNELTSSEFIKKQKELEKQLVPPTQFNIDLAKEVSEDARKLIAGQISEVEFYQKHHKAYLSEFGVDARPVSSTESTDKTPPESAIKQISRRTLLKAGGAAFASILGARLLTSKVLAAEAPPGDNRGNFLSKEEGDQHQQTQRVQMGMVIDLENCNGCLDCVYACATHNFNPAGVLWIYALAYKDENRDQPNFLLRLCQHCGNAPCVKVCPVRARHKRENDGLVLTDYNLCIGCRYCMVTCPYGVNYFQWDVPTKQNYFHEKLTDYRGRWVIGNPPKGVMGKCTFCPDRQDDGRNNVVCELVCTHNVLHFGDMNDPNSRPNRYLIEKMKQKPDLTTFRLLENQGTKPSIIYIGQQPTRSARPVDGPISYTDWGLVEERRPLLEGPEPWFLKAFGGGR